MRKKYKIKPINSIIAIFILIIVIAILYKPVTSITSLMNKKYDLTTSYKIYKKGLTNEVLNKEYSQTFEETIDKNQFKEEYFDLYFLVKYYENNNFITSINKLASKGYNAELINIINESNDKELLKIVEEKYISDIDKYMEYDFFLVKNLDRYLAYFNGDYKDTIIKVNIGLDKKEYEEVNIIKNYSYNIIVNRYNKLDEYYKPEDLVELDNCSGEGQYLTKEAKEHYDELCEASKKDGMKLSITSSYRDYESQVEIYNYYLKEYGTNYTKKYVAIPGFSEHQTGLAIDAKSLNSSIFRNSKEYTWMLNNSYKYGFILRYTKEKQELIGYNSEDWHFRYIGVEEAKYVHDNNLSYEEYYAMFLEK